MNYSDSSYVIDKNKTKKLHTKKKLIFNNKKIVAFGLGSIMIFSGASCLKNEKKSNENLSSTSITIDNENINKKIISADKINDDLMYEPEYYRTENTSSYKKANFNVGNHSDIRYIESFKTTERYAVIEKYSYQYGIDPEIMLAIACKESSLDHEGCLPEGPRYNNNAIGMMQLEEIHDGEKFTAYNYETEQYDTETYTIDNVKDYDTNVKIACMMFQNAIEKYKGNIYMAIQSHNYGEMVDVMVSMTANDRNITPEILMENPFDIDWTKYLEEIYKNPKKYDSTWKYDTYGDPNYLNTIISLCTDNNVYYKCDGESYCFDLNDGFKSKQENIKNR